MLLALGLGSQIGILEGMLCVIFDIDLFKRIKKQYMTGERRAIAVKNGLSRERRYICESHKISCASKSIFADFTIDSVNLRRLTFPLNFR